MQDAQNITDFILKDRRQSTLLSDGVEQALVELGCALAVKVDDHALTDLLQQVGGSMTPAQLQAALLHAIGYLGVPPTQRALRLLREQSDNGEQVSPTPPAELIAPSRQERIDRGIQLYDQFEPGRAAKQAERFSHFSDKYYPYALEISGLTLQSPELTLRQRQCMTVAILACCGIEPQLKFHLGVAQRVGLTAAEIAGILLYVQAYAGVPRANGAALIASEVFV